MIQYIEVRMRGEKKMMRAPDDKSIPIRIDVDNMFLGGYSGMKKIEKMNHDLRVALKKGTERQWVAAYKDP